MWKISKLVVLGAASLCYADTLTLKSGEIIEGTYLGGTARIIRMEINGQIQTYDIGMVNGLRFTPGNQGQQDSPPYDAPRDRSSSNSNPSNNNGPVLRRAPNSSSNSDSYPSANNNGGSSSSDSDRPVLRRAPVPADVPPVQPPPVQQNARNQEPDPPSTYTNPKPSAPVPSFDILSGTQLAVKMIDSVDSEVARVGDTFRASIDEPLIIGGQTVIPRGADAVAKLVEDQKSGKISGRAVLKLELVSVKINDRLVDISTDDVTKESGSRGARSAGVIGGTAALGAILGGVLGGGKGAAIGAGSGAAVGTGAQEVTKGQHVKIPSETRLYFTTSNTIHV